MTQSKCPHCNTPCGFDDVPAGASATCAKCRRTFVVGQRPVEAAGNSSSEWAQGGGFL
jgi:hypothetical protein